MANQSDVVFCPECGRGLSLINHSIAPDGTVTPSISHPESHRKADGSLCSWHPTARLLDRPNLPAPSPMPLSTCARGEAKSRSVDGWGSVGNFTGIVCAKCFRELVAS